MDKFEMLKSEYALLTEKAGICRLDERDFEELRRYTVAAALRIWAQNTLYSPDYAGALEAVTGNTYSIEQVLSAMGCCGEEDRPLRIPDFFEKAVASAEVNDIQVFAFLKEFSSFLCAMALINEDFTVAEAKAHSEIVSALIRFAKSKGVLLPELFDTLPATTEANEFGYLKNEALLQAVGKQQEKKPVEPDKSPEPAKTEPPKNDTPEAAPSITINLVSVNAGSDAEKPRKQLDEPEITDPAPKVVKPEDEGETLESLMAELDGLVGLENVKEDVHSLINFIRISKIRKERGMKVPTVSYHLVFTGNPGTGKTTVARLVARLYYHLGILPKGQFVETDRSALVAGYLGQTAIKTQKVIQEAMGGILFIDEAYSLAGDTEDSYGKEAIETILKAMEDHRDELIVIVAGYTELMHKFIDSNPGLSSRFSKYFEFRDYSDEELIAIFRRFCDKNGYVPEENALALLQNHFKKLYENRDDRFGNARTARNVFEKAINAQADRIAVQQSLTDSDLETITVGDIETVIGGNS